MVAPIVGVCRKAVGFVFGAFGFSRREYVVTFNQVHEEILYNAICKV